MLRVLPIILLLCACASLPAFLGGKRRGDGKVVATPAGQCVYLAPENALHQLFACETPATYEVTILDRHYGIPKAAFQRQLRERLRALVRSSTFPETALAAAQIEVWLSAAAFTPSDADLVVVVVSPAGNFAVREALDAMVWGFPDDVTWLGASPWPSPAARRSGVLLIDPRPNVTPKELQLFVDRALAPRPQAPPLPPVQVSGDGTALRLTTAPFAEQAIARRLRLATSASVYLQSLRWEPAGEREGYKARIAQFPFAEAVTGRPPIGL